MRSLPLYRTICIPGLIIGSLLLNAAGCASAPTAAPPAPPTSAAVGSTTIVAIAPSSGSRGTLPQFLGLPKLASGVGGVLGRIGSRLLQGLDLTGRFPGLQPKPPVLPLTDPANMGETAPPAAQAAAEIKKEEDAAPQKIMAIRYLATLGCGGCYEKVEQALLEGMDDCTESVRIEAVKALECSTDSCCKFCSSASCCSPGVRKKLEELTKAEKEQSARIRRAARTALACCATKPQDTDDIPREGPPAAPPLESTAPAAEAAQVAKDSTIKPSTFFSGIQLVSFQSPVINKSTDDMLLASVNDEPIYESQLLPLVDAKLKAGSVGAHNDANLRRKYLTEELNRVIDWKIIEQLASKEMGSVTALDHSRLSAPEIQAWFNRKLQVETAIAPQELMAYYQVHHQRYQLPTQLRWEQITVFVDRCGTRQRASAIANYLRNRALGGDMAPPEGFVQAMIAVQTSDWRELNQVNTTAIRNALASLQAGQVSHAIEDDGQLILLRVLERREDQFIPLPLAADQIVSEILSERRDAAELRFLSQARAESKIWTVFDSSDPNTLNSPTQTTSSIVEKRQNEVLDAAHGHASTPIPSSVDLVPPPTTPTFARP